MKIDNDLLRVVIGLGIAAAMSLAAATVLYLGGRVSDFTGAALLSFIIWLILIAVVFFISWRGRNRRPR